MVKTILLIIASEECLYYIEMEGLFGVCCHLDCFSGLPSTRFSVNGSVYRMSTEFHPFYSRQLMTLKTAV